MLVYQKLSDIKEVLVANLSGLRVSYMHMWVSVHVVKCQHLQVLVQVVRSRILLEISLINQQHSHFQWETWKEGPCVPFILSHLAGSRNIETAGQSITFYNIHKHFQSSPQSQVSLTSQVSLVIKFVFLMPATNAVSDWRASAMCRIKTYVRTTTTQSRLSNIMVLHIHRHLTDKVDHTVVLKEFVSANDDRRRHFGLFHWMKVLALSCHFCTLSCYFCMPDEACDGRNVALNYQVNCWCARSSKRTILYHQLSMPNNFHNTFVLVLLEENILSILCLNQW